MKKDDELLNSLDDEFADEHINLYRAGEIEQREIFLEVNEKALKEMPNGEEIYAEAMAKLNKDKQQIKNQPDLFSRGMDKDDSIIELPPDYRPMENIKIVDLKGNVSEIIPKYITHKEGDFTYHFQSMPGFDDPMTTVVNIDYEPKPFLTPGNEPAIKTFIEGIVADSIIIEPPTIAGSDIIKIRTLTGKARKQADQALRNAAAEFLKNAPAECFWIPGNTASSKNSKDIGFYMKFNVKTKKMEKVNILVDSALTKKYKRATKGYWLENKVAFLNQTRNLPIPLHLEFTFIRDSLRAFDFINATQVLADLMTEYEYYPDDDTVHLVPIFNPTVYYSQELAGVLIRVIK